MFGFREIAVVVSYFFSGRTLHGTPFYVIRSYELSKMVRIWPTLQCIHIPTLQSVAV